MNVLTTMVKHRWCFLSLVFPIQLWILIKFLKSVFDQTWLNRLKLILKKWNKA